MYYNVAQLLQQPIGSTRDYDLHQLDAVQDPDLDLIGPLDGHVRLMRARRGILVTANLVQVVRMPCSRCLAPVEVRLEVVVEEEFFPSIDLRTGAFIRWRPEDGVEAEQIISEKHILDLTEVVRQELLVALPPHPLCRPDCAGLCPVCGADLNIERCTCQRDPIDPRWAQLESLRKLTSRE